MMSMILGRNLTADETARLTRMDTVLSEHFARTRNGPAIRVCEGAGEGDSRMIHFIAGLVGPPEFSISATEFLTATDDELLRLLT